MAFETWEGYSVKSIIPTISVRRGGNGYQFGINVGAVYRYGIKDGTYAKFYYDNEKKIIGIKLNARKEESGARKVKVRKEGGHVSATGFVNWCGLESEQAKVGKIEEMQTEHGLLLTVKIEEMISRKRRRKTKVEG